MRRLAIVLLLALAACPAPKRVAGNKSPDLGSGSGGGSGDGAPPPPDGDAGVGLAPGGGGGSRGEPQLVDEEPTAVGAVDKDVLRRVVKQSVAAMRACYERVLLANPGIGGRVLVTFTIAIDGTPHDVSAAGVHPEVETCVADTFRTLRFPRPDAGKVAVTYPFTFQP